MAQIGSLTIDPPLLNSSSPWASTRAQLKSLYDCRFTGAVTTRTATLKGFEEAPDAHKHELFHPNDKSNDNKIHSSINTFGYSPRPLGEYLDDVVELCGSGGPKPVIVSVTGSVDEIPALLSSIQNLRKTIGPRFGNNIACEFNLSCPNISGAPPPAYNSTVLSLYIASLAKFSFQDPTLVIGLKLPPFTYHDQFQGVIDALLANTPKRQPCPIAYLAATNTLGSCMVYPSQMYEWAGSEPNAMEGGIGGDSIHALAVGNVAKLCRMLKEASHINAGLASVKVIGIGGVRSKEGAERMRQAGASAVACATALCMYGNGAFERISGASPS